MNNTFWQKRFRWNVLSAELTTGYTLLLPVPGDLPVFLKIALDVCSRQASDHLVETLVVPDHLTPGFEQLIAVLGKNYSISPLRLVKFPPEDQLLVERLNPHLNYWLQLIRGGMAARASHAVLHDADLFITDPQFLKNHYETCRERELACLGVSPVWDTWFQKQGISHVVATWEMIFELTWLRSFEPWQHMGHEDTLDGKEHEFDITLWPQCKTSPRRIGIHPQETGFVHFNYVICTYRWFQRSQTSYEDEHFRLLLIRLLIDAYDHSSGWPYELPSLAEMMKGLTDSSNPVTYLAESTRRNYPAFRLKLHDVIKSGLVGDERAAILKKGIAAFDKALR